MRRIAAIATVFFLGAAGLVTTVAGADDSHTYEIELDNAVGIVKGSLVRVAGVEAGEVTDLDVNPAKRAVLTVETSGPAGELGEDTQCSSEPQSLIAEYFIDCQPAGDPLPEGGLIPVDQVSHTVQPDLVQNTMREPFMRRFQLLLNEFGTALAGNPETLNDAIRRGAPALRELEQVTGILADQNRTIRDLNQNSDQVMARLAERREDVARFVREARDTAAASAERRVDLSRNFEILDDFLAELRPTLADTETLAREQTPLLRDLRGSAAGLNTLARNLPDFNDASRVSFESLGEAAIVGRRALRNGGDEIAMLRRAFKHAPRAAKLLAHLLEDAEDPRRAVEIDERAERDTGRSSSTPGTRNTMGYTALEGLLNYGYYQAGALNQYDQISHLLHFSLYDVNSGPCGRFSTGRDPETGEPGVPSQDGGTTTKPREVHRCVAWLGKNQPGLSEPFDLPRYHPSVCPHGTKPERAREELCDPDGSAGAASVEETSRPRSGGGGSSGSVPGVDLGGAGSTLNPIPGAPDLPADPGDVQKSLEDLLGIPKGANLDKALGGSRKGGGKGKGGSKAAEELMDFLLGS